MFGFYLNCCRLLLRVFLRLAKLQEQHLLRQELLPSTACLDVCLCWEAANSCLCSEAAAALLASLKPIKRKRLLEELRDSLFAALEAAAKNLRALCRRSDAPAVLPVPSATNSTSSVVCGTAASSWLGAAADALQSLVEALATLRAATCCLPVRFALRLWERELAVPPTAEDSNRLFLTPQPPKTAQGPFAASLRRVYAALVSHVPPCDFLSLGMLPLTLLT